MRPAGAAATASYRHTVGEADVAAFATGVVHRVYGTAAMVRDMEYAARLVLLDLLEPEEEGVGAEVWCRHLAPVPVGATVELLAAVVGQDDRRLVCRVEARHHGELAGEGRVVQVVVQAGSFPPPPASPRSEPTGHDAGAPP
jgi:fluoroacetyl-CoA thioesterase